MYFITFVKNWGLIQGRKQKITYKFVLLKHTDVLINKTEKSFGGRDSNI